MSKRSRSHKRIDRDRLINVNGERLDKKEIDILKNTRIKKNISQPQRGELLGRPQQTPCYTLSDEILIFTENDFNDLDLTTISYYIGVPEEFCDAPIMISQEFVTNLENQLSDYPFWFHISGLEKSALKDLYLKYYFASLKLGAYNYMENTIERENINKEFKDDYLRQKVIAAKSQRNYIYEIGDLIHDYIQRTDEITEQVYLQINDLVENDTDPDKLLIAEVMKNELEFSNGDEDEISQISITNDEIIQFTMIEAKNRHTRRK